MVKLVSERRDKTSLDVFWAERRKPRGIRQCQRTDALTDEIAAPCLATPRARSPGGPPRATAHGHTSVWGFYHHYSSQIPPSQVTAPLLLLSMYAGRE